MLHTVEAVKENEDGSVTVTTDRGGLQLTIAKDAVYGDFNGRQIMASDDLRVAAPASLHGTTRLQRPLRHRQPPTMLQLHRQRHRRT